jgi:NTE family protein
MAASGMDHEEMLRRFAEFPQTASYARMRRAFAEYRRSSGVPRAARKYFRDSGIAALSATTLSAFDDEMLEQFVAHFVGPDRSISSLGRPFSAAATDLVEGRTVSLMTGSLHVALCASCAAPGLFAPQKLNGRVLIDGAMMSELPIAAAMALGDSAPVVAVHLTRPESRIHEYASSSEVAIRTSALVRRELVREQLRHSLHLVSVPVDEVRWLDFRRSTEMEKVGFEAASAFIARRRRT